MSRIRVRNSAACGCVALIVLFYGSDVIGQNVREIPTAPSAPSIVEISGKVTDSSGAPLENAVVKAVGTDVSPVLTDARGMYKFYLVDQELAFILRVSKDGYMPKSSHPLTPKRTLTFDCVLKEEKISCVEVKMDRFESGVSISGAVEGLPPDKVGQYKVLVYVLTNQWYIHPFAETKEGRGYAGIKKDGTWSIKTVNRKDNPYKLAILVVPMDKVPPAVVPIGEDADASLNAKFGKDLAGSQILKAPSGL